ncbi:MAG: type II CAAX endopeptidase family protein [Oribacterium sp.]|nr:type II CAAX endopeptidase family protein [Oribacterium sp.]MDY6317644.1 type II CAAX endopeptidase family protein [Oribacterium sp.]
MNENKRTAKFTFTKVSMVMLLYELIFQVGSAALIAFGGETYANEDLSMLVISIVGLLVSFLILGNESGPFVEYKRFTILRFLGLLLAVYGLQAFSAMLSDPLITFLEEHGHDMEYATDVATGVTTDFWGLVYSIIGAPLFEECLFRGLFFRPLRRYGRIFAIIVTALLFALMHGNIIQFPTALFVGLLFACVRADYGLPASILLHMSNNLFAMVFNGLSEAEPWSTIYIVFLYAGMLAVIVLLIRHIRDVYEDFRDEPHLGRSLAWFFTTPAVILVILLFTALTIFSIFE